MKRRAVTKSVRLTAQEAEALARVCQEEPVSEAALLRQWVLDGLRQWKLGRAVGAYARREVSLREGAALAEVPVNVFLAEVERRGIVVMDMDDTTWRENLRRLGEEFDLPQLARAVRPPTSRGE